MDHAALVRVGERVGELQAVANDLLGGQGTGGEPRVERLSLDELHRDVGLAVRLADFVDRADVRMVERGGGPGFSHQSGARGLIVEARGQNLDRDVSVELFVPGEVDLAHPSGAELVEDDVMSESLTGG